MTEEQKQLIKEKFDTFAENLIINFGTNQETKYLTDIWADAYRKINDFMFSQIDSAIKQTEERIVERIEEYFKGLIHIPEPQLTKENLINFIRNK